MKAAPKLKPICIACRKFHRGSCSAERARMKRFVARCLAVQRELAERRAI